MIYRTTISHNMVGRKKVSFYGFIVDEKDVCLEISHDPTTKCLIWNIEKYKDTIKK